MVLRLASGSVLPASAARKRSRASTCTSGMLKWPRNSDTTSLASSCRSRPLSTKMQVSWSPIASWISTAATEQSTPPDSPQMTRPLPTWARILAISADRKCAMRPVARQAGDAAHEVADQLAAARACAPPRGGTARRRACASRRRWPRTARPSTRRPPEAGRQARDAVAVAHPHGVALALLPQPSNSAVSPVISISARPNSRWWPPSTPPPSCATMVCSP